MELIRALAGLVEPPSPESRRLARLLDLGAPPSAAEHSDLFVFQLYPYASVYLGPEGMVGGEARDRIAGFCRALGATPPEEADHLGTMLALYAELAERGKGVDGERWEHARKVFLWEHLLSWLPVYLSKLDRIAVRFYRNWGALLSRALVEAAGEDGPPGMPAHLRSDGDWGQLDDPRCSGAGPFISSLLAPGRAGAIFVRSDFERAAAELDLVARKGERRYVLEALLGQNAPAVLAWLGDEAAVQADALADGAEVLRSVSSVWIGRARATSALLSELAGDAATLDGL